MLNSYRYLTKSDVLNYVTHPPFEKGSSVKVDDIVRILEQSYCGCNRISVKEYLKYLIFNGFLDGDIVNDILCINNI